MGGVANWGRDNGELASLPRRQRRHSTIAIAARAWRSQDRDHRWYPGDTHFPDSTTAPDPVPPNFSAKIAIFYKNDAQILPSFKRQKPTSHPKKCCIMLIPFGSAFASGGFRLNSVAGAWVAGHLGESAVYLGAASR